MSQFTGMKRILALIIVICSLGLLECSDDFQKTNATTGIEFKLKSAIDFKTCLPCPERFCVKVCPKQAIDSMPVQRGEVETKTFIIDPDKCIRCGYCFEVCPVGAIYWKR